MKYSKMARDRAVRCAAMANQATDAGVRSALLDSAAYMHSAGELARSKEVVDVTVMSMPLPPLHPSAERARATGLRGRGSEDKRSATTSGPG
jgi:hypothetical protein